jgi:aryl-alcohol dehydrogenase-like predicted oxidoreductase
MLSWQNWSKNRIENLKYNKPGKSDLSISEISFGCMSLGTDHEENKKLLLTAIDKGINYFDTADIYQNGFNEVTVGNALKNVRSKVFIASKVGNQPRKDGGLDWNPSKKHILSSIDESLKRLQTDYLDLYQLHGGTIDDPFDETIETFETLVSAGKIRNYGISSIRPNVIREYIKRSSIISVMMQYSLLDRRPEEECLGLLKDHSIGVLARGSLAGGLLINKPAKDYLTLTKEAVANIASVVKEVSTNRRDETATALEYVLHHPAITSAVVGFRTVEQLNKATTHRVALTSQEYDTLFQSTPAIRYESHR